MERSEALAQLTAPGQPYELEEVELYGRPCRAFRNAPPTLRDLYESSLCDQTFLVYEDERRSFDEAWSEACRIGRLLALDCGVEKGDRVAISMRNYPEWILAFMATTSIGGIAVSMNSLWTPEEMAYGLSDSGAKVLFADAERMERFAVCAADFPDLTVFAVRTPELLGLENARTYEDALSSVAPGAMPEIAVHPNDDPGSSTSRLRPIWRDARRERRTRSRSHSR
jgi:acyl-coenzyme A synthetase/AMP-(fatty) acid ligase